jgi:hypothetical protein
METVNRQYRLRPTFGASFGTGWNVMADSFLRLFLVVVIMGLIAAPVNMLHVKVDPFNFNFHNWDMDHIFRVSTLGIIAAFLRASGPSVCFPCITCFPLWWTYDVHSGCKTGKGRF